VRLLAPASLPSSKALPDVPPTVRATEGPPSGGLFVWPGFPYLQAMLRKQPEIPPEVAADFIRDMKAFFKAKDQLAQDEIAARQSWLLQLHLPRGTKLRISDVREMFLRMKDHA
jgi:hypothetical protein